MNRFIDWIVGEFRDWLKGILQNIVIQIIVATILQIANVTLLSWFVYAQMNWELVQDLVTLIWVIDVGFTALYFLAYGTAWFFYNLRNSSFHL